MAKKTTKAPLKTATKKTSAKKAPAKKVAAKKAAAPKVAVKKVVSKVADTIAPSTPKATPAVAAAPVASSTPAKKVVETKIIARVDVGFGNSLYLRGEGAGLSWERGELMENVSPYEWVYKSTQAKTGVVFKFLINDEVWAEGENLHLSAGETSITSPAFIW